MLTQARREVIIANAYFSPAIVFYTPCVKRHDAGCGSTDHSGRTGYADCQSRRAFAVNYLVKGGVQVFEYRRRPLHAKWH